MRPTWGPSGADRTQVGPMLATWTLLTGVLSILLPYRFSIKCQSDVMHLHTTYLLNESCVSLRVHTYCCHYYQSACMHTWILVEKDRHDDDCRNVRLDPAKQSGAKTGIFRGNSDMVANALAPCVPIPSVTMWLTMRNKRVFILHGEGSQLLAPYQKMRISFMFRFL